MSTVFNFSPVRPLSPKGLQSRPISSFRSVRRISANQSNGALSSIAHKNSFDSVRTSVLRPLDAAQSKQKPDERVNDFRQERRGWKPDQDDRYRDYQQELMREKREAEVKTLKKTSTSAEKTKTDKSLRQPYGSVNLAKRSFGRKTGRYGFAYKMRHLRRENPTVMKNLFNADIATIQSELKSLMKNMPKGSSLNYSQKINFIHRLREKGFSQNDLRDVKKFLGC